MSPRPLIALVLSTLCLAGCSVPKPWTLAEGQHVQTLQGRATPALSPRIQLFLPRGYDRIPGTKWPLIVFLHGSGECGDDIEKVKVHGPPKIVQSKPDFPFIVASPQAPANAEWNSAGVNALIDELIERLPVDLERIYLTGLSLGGYGAWETGAGNAQRFAAIAPVCGVGEVKNACQLKSLPIWAFHGAQDSVVSVDEDRAMVDAVKACGGDVSFTVYPGVDHDSWTQTYENPALYEWFLQHKRRSSKP